MAPGPIPLPMPITIDGEARRSETTYLDGGAYAALLATCLPDLGVELHSTYLGAPGSPTAVASITLMPIGRATDVGTRNAMLMPVWQARRRCLYEHAETLQETLAEWHAVSIDITDTAIALIEAPGNSPGPADGNVSRRRA